METPVVICIEMIYCGIKKEVTEMAETIKSKIRTIKVKAAICMDNTNEKQTEQEMWEIVEICKNALELIDEVAAAANKVKYSIR